MHQTLRLKFHTFRDFKWLRLDNLALLLGMELIGLWLHGGESGASRLMPRWTLALLFRLLSDATVLALILLCDPFAVCWKSLLLLITFSCICFNNTGLFYLFFWFQLLNLRIRSGVREYKCGSWHNSLKLSAGILSSDDVKEFITVNLVLFFCDVEAEIDRWKNFKLAIHESILVNSEGRRIMDVILEAVPIFIDEESLLIVFVCQK